MTVVPPAAGGAAAAAAVAIAEAIKASGAIVQVEPEDFLKLIDKAENPLVVISKEGVIGHHFKYIFGFKGLAFYTKSKEPLQFDSAVETVAARKIWLPS